MAGNVALDAHCIYTAASANRASHVADWALIEGKDELVYASHKNIVVARGLGVSEQSLARQQTSHLALLSSRLATRPRHSWL